MSGAGTPEHRVGDRRSTSPHASYRRDGMRRVRRGSRTPRTRHPLRTSPSVLHALRLVKVTGKVAKPDDVVEEPCPPHTLRRCPACGVHIYDLTDIGGDDAMIEIKPVRTVRAFRFCPVCREQLAPKGSNVRITIDAENEATAIEAITHKACAQTVVKIHSRSRIYACRARGGRGLGC